jgi:hypothetical protein
VLQYQVLEETFPDPSSPTNDSNSPSNSVADNTSASTTPKMLTRFLVIEGYTSRSAYLSHYHSSHVQQHLKWAGEEDVLGELEERVFSTVVLSKFPGLDIQL